MESKLHLKYRTHGAEQTKWEIRCPKCLNIISRFAPFCEYCDCILHAGDRVIDMPYYGDCNVSEEEKIEVLKLILKGA